MTASEIGIGFLCVLLVLFVGGGFVAIIRADRKKPARAPYDQHRDIARKLDALHARHGGERSGESLRWQHEGLDVRVWIQRYAEQTPRAHLSVSGLAPISLAVEQLVGGADVRLGDPDFDGVAHVGGAPALALALLTPDVRGRMTRALLAGFVLRDETLLISTFSEDIDLLAPHLAAALAVAPLLRTPPDVTAALLGRLRTEPLRDGRLAIARQLPLNLFTSSADRAALRTFTAPDLQLALATRLDDPELWATLPEATLVQLLTHADGVTVHEAIAALHKRGTPAAVPALKRLDTREAKPLAAQAVLAIQARATGARGDLALADADGGLTLSEP